MNWSDGGIWKAIIPIVQELEYKFVLIEGKQAKKWEVGKNRFFSLEQIKILMDKEKIIDDKISIDLTSEFYVYDHSISLLTIKCSWKN